MRVRSQRLLAWWLAMAAAFYLSVSSMPPRWAALQPDWVLLLVLYWGLSPAVQPVGLLRVWCVGLLLDVLQGNVVGAHALVFVTLQYVFLKMRHQIAYLTFLHRWLWAAVILLLSQAILFALQGVIGQWPVNPLAFAAQPVIGMLLWPMMYLILNGLCDRLCGTAGKVHLTSL